MNPIPAMKKLLFLPVILMITSTILKGQGFYDINTINVIELTFRQANWDFILDSLVAAGEEGRLAGSATINGKSFDSVGVRYKGNSSYRANQVKNPLNIKLDYVINDQNLEGYQTLKLANGFKDPTMVRETMSYEIARKYMPASLSNYAKVFVNGTYLGLFTSDQDVDKYFMQTNFNVTGNTRVKGEIAFNGGPGGSSGVWLYAGTDSSSYSNRFVLESKTGWQKFIGMLDTLSNHNEFLGQVLNIDRQLWFLAFENLLVNLDSPINNPQNHYIFEDGCHRFNPIPWDLNESYGVFQGVSGQGNLTVTQLQQLSPFFNATRSNYPVISKVLNDPVRIKMYVAHMKTMINENFANGWYLERGAELQNIIDAEVQADPNKLYSYTNFKNNLNNQVGSAGPPPNFTVPGISQIMEARISYLMNLPEFTAIAPTLSDQGFRPVSVKPGEQAAITVRATDETKVYLVYRIGPGSCFETSEMFDDGAHGDGAANDDIYGCFITAAQPSVDYYFYALNDNAAKFLPERAASQYFTLSVAGSLVINEFMAANKTTVADQNGEFDDWIELYNNSGQAVSLQGWFLSDNPDNPGKWSFPDTSLSAGGYLIIWADEDQDQQGIHASFKLSQNGETIILSDNHQAMIDEVVFSAQTQDVSTGRYPNGTGNFAEMPPTFQAENRQGAAGIDAQGHQTMVRIMPNPAHDYITIIMDSSPSEQSRQRDCTISILDQTGRQVYNQKHPAQQTYNIDISSLSPGLYFLVMLTDQSAVHCKFIKR